MATPTKALTVVEYMRKPEIMERFTAMLGPDAEPYVQSVAIVVGSDDKLKECTPQSIAKSALRAASLRLSVDPATKQAWLVPYNKNIGTRDNPKWVKEAQFQPHYLGLRTLAMRTGKYWTINVSPVYEGQRVFENPLTGLHVVKESNGFEGEPKSYNPGLVDVTNRRAKDLKVIGWIAYYKAKNGEEKSVYMSSAEIDDHARKYVREYDKNQNWHDPDKRATMEMKTVLRKLLAWADLTGKESENLKQALQADVEPETEQAIDVTPEDVRTEPQPAAPTIDDARRLEAVVNKNGAKKQLGNCDASELNYVYLNSIHSENVEAAKMILREDFRMDPPQAEKKTPEQIQAELGFS